MGYIFIKGRREPIQISNERAQAVKRLRFGDVNGLGKADPHDDLDLGEWAGEIGQIRSVEIEKTTVDHKKIQEEKQRAEDNARFQKWLSMPPEQKAEQLGWFKLAWSVSNKFKKDLPPPEILLKAYEIQVQYYRKNTTAQIVPASEFRELLPNNKSATEAIAEKMAVEEIKE